MSNEELKKNLLVKIRNEYNLYINNLKSKNIDFVINKSYETSIKEDIIINIECNDFLSINQVKALLKSKNSLSEIYDDYINADYTNSDNIVESIKYTADILVDKLKEKVR